MKAKAENANAKPKANADAKTKQNTKSDADCERKRHQEKNPPPLLTPMKILNEARRLAALSKRSNTFRDFNTACDGELKWTALLCFPKSPYNEKAWRVQFEIPRNYPESPPKIKFLTPVHHPNVSKETGEMKLKILEPKNWKKTNNMHDVVKDLIKSFDSFTFKCCGFKKKVKESSKDAPERPQEIQPGRKKLDLKSGKKKKK